MDIKKIAVAIALLGVASSADAMDRDVLLKLGNVLCGNTDAVRKITALNVVQNGRRIMNHPYFLQSRQNAANETIAQMMLRLHHTTINAAIIAGKFAEVKDVAMNRWRTANNPRYNVINAAARRNEAFDCIRGINEAIAATRVHWKTYGRPATPAHPVNEAEHTNAVNEGARARAYKKTASHAYNVNPKIPVDGEYDDVANNEMQNASFMKYRLFKTLRKKNPSGAEAFAGMTKHNAQVALSDRLRTHGEDDVQHQANLTPDQLTMENTGKTVDEMLADGRPTEVINLLNIQLKSAMHFADGGVRTREIARTKRVLEKAIRNGAESAQL